MSLFKRVLILAIALMCLVLLSVGLVACTKEGVAATWAHGEIMEDDVTETIESYRNSYFSDDEEGWEDYIAERQYDPDASDESTDEDTSSKKSSKKSNKKSSKKSDSDTSSDASDSDDSDIDNNAKLKEEAEKAGIDVITDDDDTSEDEDSSTDEASSSDETSDEGTVEEMREYFITQKVRRAAATYEAEQEGLIPTDEEVDEYVEEYKEQVESQYLPGTFESIIQMQGYDDVDAFKEDAVKDLEVRKLQEQQTGLDEEDDDFDDDAWDAYVDTLMESADVQITSMPDDLSYDPAVINAEDEESSDDTTDESSSTDSDTETEDSDTTE